MLEFHIPDMTCGGCVGAITRALQNLDPQARLEPNLDEHRLRVETAASEDAVRQALADAGFSAR